MRSFTILIFSGWMTLTLFAQEKPNRGEIAIYLGVGHVAANEGTYGKGAEQGASIEFRPFQHVGFMADLNRLNHSGSISNVNGTLDYWDISGTAVQTSGSAVYHFDVPLEPYVFGGAGALRSSRDIRIKNFIVFPGNQFSSGQNIGSVTVGEMTVKKTDPEVHAGVGVRIPLGWRLSFHPQVRFVRGSATNLIHADFGLAYAW
jgi:hypothetical protein